MDKLYMTHGFVPAAKRNMKLIMKNMIIALIVDRRLIGANDMERLTVADIDLGNGKKRVQIIDGRAVRECAMDFYWRLKEYEDAEEQGLLLRLPCKAGDTVYTKCAWGIESGVVGSIEIIADRVFVNNIHGAMIGEAQNIFRTREEAEQALARMEKENE